MKIFLYFIGKPKDPHANAIARGFLGRAARYCQAEMREIRPDRVDLWAKHPSAQQDLSRSRRQADGFAPLSPRWWSAPKWKAATWSF